MIYDYTCKSCRRKFRLDRPMKSRVRNGKHHKARCPHCKSLSVKKVMHRAEIRFVGSGFYSTDNRKDG